MIKGFEQQVEQYLTEVVIPCKQSLANSKSIWALKRVNHSYLSVSQEYARLVGYENAKDLIGKDLFQLNLQQNKCIEQIHAQEKVALLEQRSTRSLLFIEKCNIMQIYALTTTPIFFMGEVVALDKKVTLVAKHNFELNRIKFLKNKIKNTKLAPVTLQEEYVIFLLILNKTQYEIADYLNVSRSRIVKIIRKLCGQLDIYGCTSKLLIDQAIANGYHRKIPPELLVLITG